MMHVGTDKAQKPNFQNLTTSFETLRMKETETFDDFNVKLSDIFNFSFNLREKIPESKAVKKIQQSLPDKFHARVVAIEENKDMNILRLDELVGNLQTFEANHVPTTKSRGTACFYKVYKDGI